MPSDLTRDRYGRELTQRQLKRSPRLFPSRYSLLSLRHIYSNPRLPTYIMVQSSYAPIPLANGHEIPGIGYGGELATAPLPTSKVGARLYRHMVQARHCC